MFSFCRICLRDRFLLYNTGDSNKLKIELASVILSLAGYYVLACEAFVPFCCVYSFRYPRDKLQVV